MKRTFWLKIWKVLKNPYVIATLIFLPIFLFFGENSLSTILGLQRENSALHKEEVLLVEGIRQDSIEAASLYNNPEALEAYGREHYYMKRPDEDLFIVKNTKK